MNQVSVLSSMATRALLAELAAAWDDQTTLEAVGGVDAVRRVRAGERIDVVVLADGPMRALEADGFLLTGSLEPIAVAIIGVAVRTGDDRLDLSDSGAVRRTIEAAGRIGYSTGPSGDYLLNLLERWGIHHALDGRLVQSPPGVPVGRLLAQGMVDLAVQQMSELVGIPGIKVEGPFPSDLQIETVFTAGLATTVHDPELARRFIAVLTAVEAASVKSRHGLMDFNVSCSARSASSS